MSHKNKDKSFDFSQSAVQKAVAKSTLEHPGVLYPGALSVLGGFAALLFGGSPLFIAAAAGGAGVAFVSWLINYGMRRDHFANAYIKKVHQQMEQQRHRRKKQVSQALKEVRSSEGQSQFDRLGEKFDAFERLLAKKLNPSELTYGRYLGIAEQVYLGGIDNLQQVANSLSAIQVIDIGYIDNRLSKLRKSADHDAEAAKEIAALEQRLALHQQQSAKVKGLLAQNEEAMTKIDLTMAAIADMRAEDVHASMDIESAMEELHRLAGRAKDYSVK